MPPSRSCLNMPMGFLSELSPRRNFRQRLPQSDVTSLETTRVTLDKYIESLFNLARETRKADGKPLLLHRPLRNVC